MNPARGSFYGDGPRQPDPVDSSSVGTAAQITAWLIAVACIALLTLLS